MLTFRLPLPPSLNNMFATFNGRRIPSREYKAWKADAGPKVMEQWIQQDQALPERHYALHYRVNIDHKSDIGNREKAATDLLVSTIPGFPGDQWCDQISIMRDRTIEGAIVEVMQLADDLATEPSLQKVIGATADRFKIDHIEFLNGRRRAYVTSARQLAMLVAARTTSKSYPQIGRAFNRDHSTIIYGVEQAEKRVANDPTWAGHFACIKATLG